MTPVAYAVLNLDAIQHNLSKVRSCAPDAKIMAVIKANGYGHGILRIAAALNCVDAFAVARVEEGIRLRKAGITNPLDEIDVVEMYVPFSWFEPMWLENIGFAPKDHGWRFVEDGVTQIDGRLPVNPSGGVLSTNPIGASGMIRFGEAAMQVMGKAGEHQIDGVRKAFGHAYGGGSQFFAMWVVGADKP